MPREHRKFQANLVECHTQDWGNSHLVHGIYFAEGPKESDESWNFTRSTRDDDGVCTVKEIQELTLYECIESFAMSRRGATCRFNSIEIQQLEVTYNINESTWIRLKEMAQLVFFERDYFHVIE